MLEIDPNDVSAWESKGEALSALKKYEEAIKCYNRAIKCYNKEQRKEQKSRFYFDFNDAKTAKEKALKALGK